MKQLLIAAAVAALVPLLSVSVAPAAQAKTPAQCAFLQRIPNAYTQCLGEPGPGESAPGIDCSDYRNMGVGDCDSRF
jgi:hypothetical protein